MSRLAAAIIAVTDGCTVDEVAAIIGEPRATAGRWLKRLREDGDLVAWSAEAVERLAGHEHRTCATTRIADALRPEPAPAGEADAESLRRQINRANRKNSSLMLGLDEVRSPARLDREQARTLLVKTDAALQETSQQQTLLARWRQALSRRLRQGG